MSPDPFITLSQERVTETLCIQGWSQSEWCRAHGTPGLTPPPGLLFISRVAVWHDNAETREPSAWAGEGGGLQQPERVVCMENQKAHNVVKSPTFLMENLLSNPAMQCISKKAGHILLPLFLTHSHIHMCSHCSSLGHFLLPAYCNSVSIGFLAHFS